MNVILKLVIAIPLIAAIFIICTLISITYPNVQSTAMTIYGGILMLLSIWVSRTSDD